jgi:hypothetical protein
VHGVVSGWRTGGSAVAVFAEPIVWATAIEANTSIVKTTNAFRTLFETFWLESESCVGSGEELGMTSSGKIEITHGAIQKTHGMDTGRKSGAAKCSGAGTCPSRRGPRNPARDAELAAKHIATVFAPAFAPGRERLAAFLCSLRGTFLRTFLGTPYSRLTFFASFAGSVCGLCG